MKINKPKFKFIIICVILLVILAAASIFVYFKFFSEVKDEYTNKLDVYDYSSLYNNKKATSSQKVTKLEALKLVIASSTNITDVKNLIIAPNYDNEDELWLKIAYNNKIVTENEVNINNCNQKVKYVEVINYLFNAQKNILKVDNVDNSIKILYTDLERYTNSQKDAINSLVNSSIIENISKPLDGNKNIKKKRLNEIIVKYVTKFNTISMRRDDVTVTEKGKLPSNEKEYPYILDNVDKTIYEQPFFNVNTEYFKNPAEYYKEKEGSYKLLKDTCENFYNSILNIDYTSIDENTFATNLQNYAPDISKHDAAKAYIDYIKTNEIIIKGNATAQLPIVYNDGNFCRVRLKLEFEIVNSKTDNNILYLDSATYNDVIYDKNKYTLYIDAELSSTVTGKGNVLDQLAVIDILLPISQGELTNKGGE